MASRKAESIRKEMEKLQGELRRTQEKKAEIFMDTILKSHDLSQLEDARDNDVKKVARYVVTHFDEILKTINAENATKQIQEKEPEPVQKRPEIDPIIARYARPTGMEEKSSPASSADVPERTQFQNPQGY